MKTVKIGGVNITPEMFSTAVRESINAAKTKKQSSAESNKDSDSATGLLEHLRGD